MLEKEIIATFEKRILNSKVKIDLEKVSVTEIINYTLKNLKDLALLEASSNSAIVLQNKFRRTDAF